MADERRILLRRLSTPFHKYGDECFRVPGSKGALPKWFLPLIRGPEAAPTFRFPRNEKVGAASGPRKEVPIREPIQHTLGTWNSDPLLETIPPLASSGSIGPVKEGNVL